MSPRDESCLEPSEGAFAALDAAVEDLQAWIAGLEALRRQFRRTASLCAGATAGPEARRLAAALAAVAPLPRSLVVARTRRQAEQARAASRASCAMLARLAEGEPGGLIDTFGD